MSQQNSIEYLVKSLTEINYPKKMKLALGLSIMKIDNKKSKFRLFRYKKLLMH